MLTVLFGHPFMCRAALLGSKQTRAAETIHKPEQGESSHAEVTQRAVHLQVYAGLCSAGGVWLVSFINIFVIFKMKEF